MSSPCSVFVAAFCRSPAPAKATPLEGNIGSSADGSSLERKSITTNPYSMARKLSHGLIPVGLGVSSFQAFRFANGCHKTTHSTQLYHIGHNCQLRVGTALNP